MAIIWAEGFDHYGTSPNNGRDNMLAGAWAEFVGSGSNWPVIDSTYSRTGTYSLRFPDNSQTSSPLARRLLGGTKTVVGIAFGLHLDEIPAVNNTIGCRFANVSNTSILAICLQSDGSITIKAGTAASGTVIGSTDPVLTASAWNHVEVKAIFDSVVGEVEVRFNGVSVLHLTDQNLGSAGAANVAWGRIGNDPGSAPHAFNIDDLVLWDDTGDVNTSFVGPARVTTTYVASDTAQADFSIVGTTDGYEAIDDTVPDGDTTYIGADTLNDISEFGISELPPEISTINAIYIPAMAKLASAGVGNVQVSLVSNSLVELGVDTPLTTAYTYWGNVFQIDPDTDTAWTKQSLEAALLRVEKTA